MILRSLASAIRGQNWFTVVLEILIVVSGIFIGLQVDGWNDARKDRLTEQRYLERIYAALAADIVSIERSIESANSRRGMGQLLLQALDDPELVHASPGAFFIAIEQAGYTLSPTINDFAFEELKNSGRLAIIQSDETREALTAYYKLIERYEQWGFLRESFQNTYNEQKLGILTADQYAKVVSFFGEVTEIALSENEALEALERMREKIGFVDQIPQASGHSQAINVYRSWRDAAEDLRDVVGTEIGQATEQ